MALEKIIPTEYGIEATYHKVALTNINWFEKIAHIELVGFVNQEARLENKRYINITIIDIPSNEFDFSVDDNIVQKCYEKIKQLDEFKGAQDC